MVSKDSHGSKEEEDENLQQFLARATSLYKSLFCPSVVRPSVRPSVRRPSVVRPCVNFSCLSRATSYVVVRHRTV